SRPRSLAAKYLVTSWNEIADEAASLACGRSAVTSDILVTFVMREDRSTTCAITFLGGEGLAPARMEWNVGFGKSKEQPSGAIGARRTRPPTPRRGRDFSRPRGSFRA